VLDLTQRLIFTPGTHLGLRFTTPPDLVFEAKSHVGAGLGEPC
jgi:hypothetical protein